MQRLSADPRFEKVAVFLVDFDSSQALLGRWRVAYQSTLLAFRGKVEVMRSVGETEPGALRRVFEAAR